MYRIAYDCTLRRPGCVLIQAALGGTVPDRVFTDLFPAETWLVAPTPDMKVYTASLEQLERVAAKTVERP